MTRIPRLALILLTLAVGLAGQVDGLPIAKITLRDSLSFADQRQLMGLMKLKTPSIFGLGSTPFSRRALKVDAITLRNFFVSRGYLEAQVADSFTVLPDGRVEVIQTIDRGRQYNLTAISIAGNRHMTREEIINFLGVQLGEPYNPVVLRNRLEDLRHHYQNQGKLAVDILEEIEIEDGIRLRLTISEGLTYSVGDVTIRGLTHVPEWTVRRELLFEYGDTFNRSKLLLSQRRIFESGMFGAVEIIPTLRASGPGVADLEIRIRELKRRSVDLSLGFRQTKPPGEGEPNTALYSSVQFWRARVLNSSVRTGLTVEGDLTLENIGKPNFLLAWDIITPWTLGLRIPTSLRFFSDYRASQGPTLWQSGIELSFVSKRLEKAQLRGAFGWVFIKASGDLPDETVQGAEPRLKVDYRYRGVDNLLAPRRGTVFQLLPSIHGTFLDEVDGFAKLEVDFRRYRPIFRPAVLAYRFKFSILEAWPLGSSLSLKRYHLFELGGSTSLRGWLDPGKFSKVGGTAKVLANIELRIPLFWVIGGELFLDGGALRVFLTDRDRGYDAERPAQHWITGWDFGIGLLISTPLGPIRMDAAFQDARLSTAFEEASLSALIPTYQLAFLHTF
ncbi:MAG: BamA/TamA family outer membrane protein [Candidatus Marinimicrobia bacterium]|nr:BamA/TamA family outer membrane protein [Candidatus Neomarinimicrobiota bacterium]